MAEKFSVDGDAVRALAQLLNDTQLNEVEYQVGTHRIKVARTPSFSAPIQAAPVVVSEASAPLAASAAPAPAPAPVPQPAASVGESVNSPMVGTAYLKPDPDSQPFVKPGDIVQEGDTLLIIEAMKVMNPIKAPRSGKVVQVTVADGAPVEFGEPLVTLQ